MHEGGGDKFGSPKDEGQLPQSGEAALAGVVQSVGATSLKPKGCSFEMSWV